MALKYLQVTYLHETGMGGVSCVHCLQQLASMQSPALTGPSSTIKNAMTCQNIHQEWSEWSTSRAENEVHQEWNDQADCLWREISGRSHIQLQKFRTSFLTLQQAEVLLSAFRL